MNPPAPRLLAITPTLGESGFLAATVAAVAGQRAAIRHVLAAPAAQLAALRHRFPATETVPDAGPTGGIYGALNAALTALRDADDWDWFTYINDDDTLLPGCGEMAWRQPLAPGARRVLYGDVALIDEAGRRISWVTIERRPKLIPALLQQGISPLMQQGTLFSRALVRALGGFDLRYRLCADLDFWLRAYAAGADFRAFAQPVAEFRLRPGQLSGATEVTRAEQAAIVQRHLPRRVPALRRCLARWRYRLCNAPRYLARVRRRGWRTSYQLLDSPRAGAPVEAAR